MAPTQGVLVDLEVTATLRKISDPQAKPIVVTATCEAKAAAHAPNRLLRAGAPAGKDAVLREDDGTHPDRPGRPRAAARRPRAADRTADPAALARTRREPAARSGQVPARRASRAPTRPGDQALAKLSEMGLVPPLHGKPTDRPGGEPRAASCEPRPITDITGRRGGHEHGLPVRPGDPAGRAPHRPRTADPPVPAVRHAGLRRRHPGRHHRVGRFIARLGISSRRQPADLRPVEVGAALRRCRREQRAGRRTVGPGRPVGPQAEPERDRTELQLDPRPPGQPGHAEREHRPRSTWLRQGIRITVHRDDRPGRLRAAGRCPGQHRAAVRQLAGQGRGAGVRGTDPKPPHAEAVSQSIPVAVDAGDPADRLFAAVDAIRADTTGFLQLHAALSLGEPGLQHGVDTTAGTSCRWSSRRAPANPAQAVADRTLLPQRVQGGDPQQGRSARRSPRLNDQNTANINFTMNDVGHTSGTSTSGGVSADGGGGAVDADELRRSAARWASAGSAVRRSRPAPARPPATSGCGSTTASTTS